MRWLEISIVCFKKLIALIELCFLCAASIKETLLYGHISWDSIAAEQRA